MEIGFLTRKNDKSSADPSDGKENLEVFFLLDILILIKYLQKGFNEELSGDMLKWKLHDLLSFRDLLLLL